MKSKTPEFLKDNFGWVAFIAALLGLSYYVIQSWDMSHRLTTFVWDEAMYLFKGYQFAAGDFHPFEDFGPWTNQMPVAFLIPGYVQKWFGLGMRTGRVYAVVLGLLTVVGLWLAAYRAGGKWWAAGIVWVVALNGGWINTFSRVNSQVLVSFFFAWMLAFIAGKNRKSWELCLAAILAGLAGMSRINVLPVVFLFMLYVVWQYGWKAGAWVIGAGLVPIVLFHAICWPDILKIWAYWIPPELYTGIAEFRSPWRELFLPEGFSWWPASPWLGNPEHLAWQGVFALLLAIRASFVPFFGVMISLILWPKKENWKTEYQRKFSMFLIVLYFIMFLVHIWAAIGGNTCRFSCLPGYMLFFNLFGLVLITSSASSWNFYKQTWKQIAIVLLVVVLVFVMLSSYSQNTHELRKLIGQRSFGINIPRIKNGEILPGSIPLLNAIENKFGIDAFPVRQYILYNPGFDEIVRWGTIWGLTLLFPIILSIRKLKEILKCNIPFCILVLFSTLGLSAVFSSKELFAQGLAAKACEDEVIGSHEQVGSELNAVIPRGELVYWNVKSDMLLLYLPDVDIYLPQANGIYTLVDDPDADWEELQKFGWWNYELREHWKAEADYFVIESRNFDGTWEQQVDHGEFEIIIRSSNPESCRAGISNVVVLRRVLAD